jgi:hypothetical protein
VRSALPCLKQRLATTRDCAIALCTMTDANAIPDGIVGASVVTALFLFIAMLGTDALGLEVVGTLWIFALPLFAMLMKNTHYHVSWLSFCIVHALISIYP